MEVIRGVIEDGFFGDNLRPGIGREQVMIGGCVEFALVADQDVDRALELGRRAETIFEPDMEIIGGRRHALLAHQPHRRFRDGGCVVVVKRVECGDRHCGR